MGRHRGRFKWRKYSRYNGNLQDFWTDKSRQAEHALGGDDDSGSLGVSGAWVRPAAGQRQEVGEDAVPIPPGQRAIRRRFLHLRGFQLPWLRSQGRADQAANDRERGEPCRS